MPVQGSSRFTYANVASTLALVVAIGGGGTATALAAVAANSVGTAQIVNGSVSTEDLRGSAVRSDKVLNESLTGSDIKGESLGSTDIKNGSLTHADFTTNPVGLVRGYAWVSNGSTPIDTLVELTGTTIYNSAGGPVTVTRQAVGTYVVVLTGLTFSNVQVTGQGVGNVMCRVTGWAPPSVSVHCFDVNGTLADSMFDVTVAR